MNPEPNSPTHQLTKSPLVRVALTRAVPAAIHRCELTHLARNPIDYDRAVLEHDAYERALEALGCRVERLPDTPGLPDSVFVEDTAVVLDDIAIVTRPGAEARRPETASVADALRHYRRLTFIEAPGTLDGGDVLRIGSRLYVGRTPRSNADGARQLAALVRPHGMTVTVVDVRGCLHLKSAVTLAREAPPTIVVNPAWVDARVFEGCGAIAIDPSEPFAANVLLIGDAVLCAAEFPRTRHILDAAGVKTSAVPAGELAKAEGGLTCGSLLVTQAVP